jgi:nitrite reductase (NAD(P)H)
MIVEMADILAFNLTQTEGGQHKPRKMNDPDLSTKLKLMGVDVSLRVHSSVVSHKLF